MSSADIQSQAIAGVYADAIFGLAQEQGQAQGLLEEVAQLEALLSGDAAFASYLTDPEVDAGRRAETIEKALRGRASDLLVDALRVINDKDRMEVLPAILSALREAYERSQRIAEVLVTTAVPLADDLRASLTAAAQQYTGRQVRLVESLDESLLGGLIVRVGDIKLDTSLSRHLKRVHELLDEQGMRAIYGSAERRFIEGITT